jgi:transposase-like protein
MIYVIKPARTRQEIINALTTNNHNVSAAARALGVSRHALYIRFNRDPTIRQEARAITANGHTAESLQSHSSATPE